MWKITFNGECVFNLPTKEEAEKAFWDNCFLKFDAWTQVCGCVAAYTFDVSSEEE